MVGWKVFDLDKIHSIFFLSFALAFHSIFTSLCPFHHKYIYGSLHQEIRIEWMRRGILWTMHKLVTTDPNWAKFKKWRKREGERKGKKKQKHREKWAKKILGLPHKRMNKCIPIAHLDVKLYAGMQVYKLAPYSIWIYIFQSLSLSVVLSCFFMPSKMYIWWRRFSFGCAPISFIALWQRVLT